MGRKKYAKKVPQTHRKSKGSPVVAFLAVCLMCLSVLFALSLTVFFKTKSITVQGRTIYSNEQIVAASGMGVGRNMFISMFAGAAGNIEKMLPYVGNAEITRNLDGNVVITVEPAVVTQCFQMADGYLLVDSNGKALETVAVAPLDKPIISGVELSSAQAGLSIKYSNESARELIDDVFSSAKDNGFNLSALRTDADFSFVDVVIENKYLVHMVNGSDVDYKFLMIKKSLEAQPDSEEGSFSFSTVDDGRVIFSPGSIFGEPEEESPEEGGTAPEDEVLSSQPEENGGE